MESRGPEEPFTLQEQRFMLAEMIKTSSVDVEHLAHFIRSNEISPNWGDMLLPRLRSRNECARAAELLAIPSHVSSYNNPRYPPNTYAAAVQRRPPAAVEHYSSVPAVPPPYSHQVPILPRPVNGTTEPQSQYPNPALPQPARPATSPRPKKRGRPSRADRAQRELRPILPPHLMPRPSTEPRTIVPASSGPSPPGQPNTYPCAAPSTSPTRGTKRRRAASAEVKPELLAAEERRPWEATASSTASAPERRT